MASQTAHALLKEGRTLTAIIPSASYKQGEHSTHVPSSNDILSEFSESIRQAVFTWSSAR